MFSDNPDNLDNLNNPATCKRASCAEYDEHGSILERTTKTLGSTILLPPCLSSLQSTYYIRIDRRTDRQPRQIGRQADRQADGLAASIHTSTHVYGNKPWTSCIVLYCRRTGTYCRRGRGRGSECGRGRGRRALTKQPDNQTYLSDPLAYPVPDTCRCLSPALLFIHAYMKWHLSATNPSSNPGA